jgi:hypothetical protein
VAGLASQNTKCFIVMPFGVQDLEDLYSEFITSGTAECSLMNTRL